MFKVYVKEDLVYTTDCPFEAAIKAGNISMYLPIGENAEVYGPKTDFIHFNIGDKNNENV